MTVIATNRRLNPLRVSASVAVIVLAAGLPAQAQNWDGSESSDWRNGDNWVGGAVPTGATPVRLADTVPNPAVPNPTVPVTNMPTIDGGTVTLGTALIGYSHAQGGITLTISNGATFAVTSAIVGEGNNGMAIADRATQSGTVKLLGGSTWNADSITIGSYGDGIVNITGGSKLTTSQLTMGANVSPPHVANGSLTISGTGSQMTVNTSASIIGNSGQGTITVENGGKLTTDSVTLGVLAASEGTISVTGNEAKWVRTLGTINIGQSGTGNVTVSNGGVVSFQGGTGLVNLASNAGSSGSLTVTGNGSRFQAGQLFAGLQSTATISATDGAVISATQLRLGTAAAGRGNLTASGTNTEIEATTHAMIGVSGRGVLSLSDNATLRTPILNVALLTGSQGTLNIGAAVGSAALAPGIVVAPTVIFGAGTGALVFNHTSADYSFAPALSGTGTVRQIAGTTVLSGTSNAFLGTTQVEGGLLRVSGTLGGSISVSSGATLAGNGKVGTTQLNSGAIIAPDGTLNVAGNLTFAAGSIYNVDASTSTGSDLIASTGTVTINGGTVNHQASGGAFSWETPHKIVSADTLLTGTFDSISTQMAFLDASLDYTKPNQVWMNLKRNDISFSSVANGTNQQGVSQVLSNLPLNHPLVQALTVLSAEQAQDALDQLSGDTNSTIGGANIELSNQVQGLSNNRIKQSFSGVSQGDVISSYMPSGLYAGEAETPVGVWAQGLAEFARVEPNGGAGGLTSASGGVVGGADILLNDWRIGMMGGYTGSNFGAINRQASGTAQNIHAGVYAGTELDALRLQANALLTWHGLTTRRDVTFGGLTDTLSASYGARTMQLFGEAGYVFDLGSVNLEPFGSLAYALTNTDAYSETGGPAALSSAASSNNATITVLGARVEAPFAVNDMLVTVRGMLGWQHQNGTAPSSQVTLAGGAPFTVSGASFSGNALVYEAGVNLDLNTSLNLDVIYSGQLSGGDVSHAIKGTIAASF